MKKIKTWVLLVIMICCTFLPGISFLTSNKTSAEIELTNTDTIIDINNDANYGWTIQGKSRVGNQPVMVRKVAGSQILNGLEEIDYYYCYDWSLTKFLSFIITPRYDRNNITVSRTDLWVSYIQTSEQSHQTEDATRFYSATSYNIPTINYYVENDPKENPMYFGYGFGIYRFELTYTYTYKDTDSVEQIEQGPFTKSVGEIYIYITPDKAEDQGISTFKIKIDSIGSSNQFLKVYNLSIVEQNFNYVDPLYIVWTAEGFDLNNRSYVLTQIDKDNSNDENSLVLWEIYYPQNGIKFKFDSHEVEGEFTIKCKIYATDGRVCAESEPLLLRTKKDDGKLPVVVVVLIVVLALASVGGIVLLIVILTRRHKKLKKNKT